MDDQVCDNFEYHNVCVRVVNKEGKRSNVVDQACKKRKVSVVAGKRRSFVWEHFDVIEDGGKLHARCKYCEGTNYRAEGHFGTSNCSRHLKTCKAYTNASNKNSLAKNFSDFDEQVYCKLLAEAIVSHGYPLSIVENEGFRKLHLYLNPKVNTISSTTIKNNVEALVTARNGYENANGDGVIIIKDSDADAESLECCSVLN